MEVFVADIILAKFVPKLNSFLFSCVWSCSDMWPVVDSTKQFDFNEYG